MEWPGLSLFIRLKTSRFARCFNHASSTSKESADFPRIIWIFWDKGEKNAPDLVQSCIAQWRMMNPGWDVRVLDDKAFDLYPEARPGLEKHGLIPETDRLRTRLLMSEGGVWADATTWCSAPLDHWLLSLMSADMFMFSRPGPDRLISNWFIAAFKSSLMISMISDAFDGYLDRKAGRCPYFGYHYTVEYLVRTKLNFARSFKNMPKLSADPSHKLVQWLHDDKADPEKKPDLSGVPIHKLNYKIGLDLEQIRDATDAS